MDVSLREIFYQLYCKIRIFRWNTRFVICCMHEFSFIFSTGKIMAIMGKRFKSKIIYLLIPLIIFLAGYRIISLWNRFLPDFDVFYYAAQETLYYHNPYQSQKLFTAFNYPVTTILLYLPLLLFPYTQAQNIFLIITMLFIPLIILLSLHILKKYRLTYFLFFYFLSLLFFPINFTLGMGQSNIIGLFFIMMSYYFLSQS